MMMSDMVAYTPGEERLGKSILAVMEAMNSVDERGVLIYNVEEYIAAIHILQSFLKQHIVHRLFPDEFSDWWEERDGKKGNE